MVKDVSPAKSATGKGDKALRRTPPRKSHALVADSKAKTGPARSESRMAKAEEQSAPASTMRMGARAQASRTPSASNPRPPAANAAQIVHDRS